ncbi:MAG: AmmeMemoRadiSam system protein A [Bacilli bacterium]|nr:AmmeMemoRadiSam system protein A [Bacilli bacterium]MBR6949007.1 AmmeMemoRadiSam system protein A [Bacilli bacterium]
MNIIGAFTVPHPPLIIPEVGRGRENIVSKTIDSYNKVGEEIANLKPDTIIISSPHAPYYRNGFYISGGDYLDGDMHEFGARDVSFTEEVDTEFVYELQNLCDKNNIPTAIDSNVLDHGTMVPLYFIRKHYPNCKIVVLGISDLPLIDHYKFGKQIQEVCNKLDKKFVYVASGDLSHKLQVDGPYGFIKEGPEYDEEVMYDLSQGLFNNLLEYKEAFLDKAAPCGHPSFCMMAGALDSYNVRPTFYSHEDKTGVGYGILSFYPIEYDSRRNFEERYLESHIVSKSKDPYIRLAQETIEAFLIDNRTLTVNDIKDKELLNDRAGVFVSIHEFDKLRGCIGTFMPTRSSIGEEIIRNAIAASTEDYRFEPIKASEVPYLDINVDILSIPEKIASYDELDPKKYGVIVSSGNKRGLLLPDLDGVDTVEEQVRIAKSKGNITDLEEIELQRFTVTRHKDN